MGLPAIDRMMLQALRASKIRGVRLAIVTDNREGEGNPGYRVKLKFPWLSEQETTFWARIAIPMAGPGRGTYVLPEIEDQVLVVFEHGDVDRPIVVGTLWSRKQEPVEVNQSGKNNTKLIKSRSGHRVIFDDQEGAEKIAIVDQTKKNKIVLDSASKTVKIESDGEIEVEAKANIILHSNALKVGTKEAITGKGKSLLVHAQKTFGLKATSGITMGGGSTTINVSNAAATSVSGSGSGELGGAAAEPAKDQIEVRNRDGGSGAGGRNRETSSGRDTRGNPVHPDSVHDDPPTGQAIKDDQIEILVVNVNETPVADLEFKLTFPDGSTKTGRTAGDGFIRFSHLTQRGECTLDFPDLEQPSECPHG
jgi:phage baseplate assembly protein gpV